MPVRMTEKEAIDRGIIKPPPPPAPLPTPTRTASSKMFLYVVVAAALGYLLGFALALGVACR